MGRAISRHQVNRDDRKAMNRTLVGSRKGNSRPGDQSRQGPEC
jgi:hypothetical protein